MLGGLFGLNSAATGWAILFVAGMVFAFLYAYWWLNRLPGPAWQRGLIYGTVPWLVMMVIVAPLLPVLNPAMDARTVPGFFFVNTGIIATFESLVAFLMWGIALGVLDGNVAGSRVNTTLATVTLLPFLVLAILVVTQKRYSPIVIDQDLSGVTTYDPGRVSEPPALPVVYNVYDRLVAREGGDHTRIVPSLAQSWTVSQDSLVYTFELRHGVLFPSGVELSADDVMWSYRRLKHLNDRPSHLADVIADVRAVEHYIVRIRLTRPVSDFLSLLTSPQFGVLDGRTVLAQGGMASAEAATSDKATPWLNAHSAGTGPWILESYKPHRETVLVRNPDYWGGNVYHGRVIFRHEQEAASRLRDLESGRADIALDLSTSEIGEARRSRQIRLLESNLLTIPVRETVQGIGVVPMAILDLRSASKE
jgi:ABC-type transport system substrate-binding protein